jgi:hypothetical protein
MAGNHHNPHHTRMVVKAEAAPAVVAQLPDLFNDMITLTAPGYCTAHDVKWEAETFSF